MANLITKAQYKAHAGISSTSQDAEIDSLITKVSAFVKTYCRRTFIDYYGDAKTETFNGGTNTLYLKESPIITVLSVDYSSDYGQNYVMLTDYVDFTPDYINDAIISLKPTGFPYAINGYRVTYTAGYDSVPADVALATIDLISYYMQNNTAIHSTKTPGSHNTEIEFISSAKLPGHIRRILDLYVLDYA
jgi:hypothetical protein